MMIGSGRRMWVVFQGTTRTYSRHHQCYHRPSNSSRSLSRMSCPQSDEECFGTDYLREERQLAISAVLKASLVTERVYREFIKDQLETHKIDKKDHSPVTIGDYTSQAIINYAISNRFPNDTIIGEEDSNELINNPSNLIIKQTIIRLLNETLNDDQYQLPIETDESVWNTLRANQNIPKTEEDWLKIIDLGKEHIQDKDDIKKPMDEKDINKSGSTNRFWTLDPIDGTKGFLRGAQYAICLALVIDGEVELGVIATPHLPIDGLPDTSTTEIDSTGLIFISQKNKGSYQRTINNQNLKKNQMKKQTIETLKTTGSFCESYESDHSDQNLNFKISFDLNLKKFNQPIRIDSQTKYCLLAKGLSDIYLRLPNQKNYEEKIWDHAAGCLIVEESGGKVRDMNGLKLDFNCGRTLKSNRGILACHSDIFDHVLNVVKKSLDDSSNL